MIRKLIFRDLLLFAYSIKEKPYYTSDIVDWFHRFTQQLLAESPRAQADFVFDKGIWGKYPDPRFFLTTLGRKWLDDLFRL